jgi:hypothetical protein
MPYLNKRNRFISAAKQYAVNHHSTGDYLFNKTGLLEVAQSINMKGIPTWVLKDCQSDTKGIYDLTPLIVPTVTV